MCWPFHSADPPLRTNLPAYVLQVILTEEEQILMLYAGLSQKGASFRIETRRTYLLNYTHTKSLFFEWLWQMSSRIAAYLLSFVGFGGTGHPVDVCPYFNKQTFSVLSSFIIIFGGFRFLGEKVCRNNVPDA